jgi:hypothetical protein
LRNYDVDLSEIKNWNKIFIEVILLFSYDLKNCSISGHSSLSINKIKILADFESLKKT